jgi:hypothetical protein
MIATAVGAGVLGVGLGGSVAVASAATSHSSQATRSCQNMKNENNGKDMQGTPASTSTDS